MADGESECAVCGQHTGKARVHYGGMSCYSCRAFFRRNTQREELPLCKAESECMITKLVRKQCAACRYAKCIRIGMKPELVLDDDEKRTRFRKHLSKKDSEHEHDARSQVDISERNNSISPPYQVETSPPPSIHDHHERLSFHPPDHPLHTSDPSPPNTSLMYNSRPSPPKSQNLATTKSTPAKPNYLFEPPITEIKTEINIGQSSSLPYTQNSSTMMNPFENPNYNNYLMKKNSFPTFPGEQQPPFQMFPETPQQNLTINTHGEKYRNWTQLPQCSKSNNASHQNMFYGTTPQFKPQHPIQTPTKTLEINSKKEDFYSYPFQPQTYDHTHGKSVIKNNDKDESLKLLSHSMSDLSQFTNSSEIPSTSSKTYQSILKPKEEVDYATESFDQIESYRHGEDMIQRYVQYKKDLQCYSENNLYFEKHEEPSTKVAEQGKRKSVIVRAGGVKNNDVNRELEKVTESNMNDIINQTLSLIPDAGEMLKNFNFDLMQDLYTNEEQNHVARLVTLWQEKWDEISFGQNIVNQYITFCQYRTKLPAEFFKGVNLQNRERCLSFVCSLEEISEISSADQIFLFRRNLENVEMLCYVHTFNQSTWTDELDFVMGKNDKIQWMERDTSISGLPLSSMVCNMTLSEVDKLELYKNLMSCTVSLLGDRTVFILMTLVIIFSQDKGEQVGGIRKVKNNYLTMLMRYLLQKRGTDIDIDMNMVYSCIAALPTIGRSFAKIKESMAC